MRRHGFSLLELMVVVAITALLTGVVSPVLRMARGQGLTVVCSSNIRQLAMALSLYEQSNGVFPAGFDDRHAGVTVPAGGYPGNPDRDDQGNWWFHHLEADHADLSSRGSLVRCPSSRVKEGGVRSNVLCGNYGVNRAILRDEQRHGEFAGRPLSSNQIKSPSGTLLLADSGYALMSWRGAASGNWPRLENARRDEAVYVPGLSINSERQFSAMFEEDAVRGRHPGKAVNAAYADGHVEQVSAERLLVESDGVHWRNRSPLWLP